MTPDYKPIIAAPVADERIRENENNGISPGQTRAEHRRSEIIRQAPTAALKKLNEREAKLARELEQIEAEKSREASLVERWNGLVAARDNAAAEIEGAKSDLALVGQYAGERAEAMRSTFGQASGSLGRGNGAMRHRQIEMAGQVLAAKLLAESMAEWLPERESALAALESDLAAFRKLHQITA